MTVRVRPGLPSRSSSSARLARAAAGPGQQPASAFLVTTQAGHGTSRGRFYAAPRARAAAAAGPGPPPLPSPGLGCQALTAGGAVGAVGVTPRRLRLAAPADHSQLWDLGSRGQAKLTGITPPGPGRSRQARHWQASESLAAARADARIRSVSTRSGHRRGQSLAAVAAAAAYAVAAARLRRPSLTLAAAPAAESRLRITMPQQGFRVTRCDRSRIRAATGLRSGSPQPAGGWQRGRGV